MTVREPLAPAELVAGTATRPDADAPELPSTRRRAPLGRLLRAEVRWIFRRPRTLVVLALLAVIPVVTGVAVDLTLDGGSGGGGLGGPAGAAPSFVTLATSAFALPLGSLMTLLFLMLPLTVAMASGDAFAGEYSTGALRGWLLAPVGRGRLLVVKAAGVLVVALASSTLVVLSGFLTGLALAGTDGLVSMSGTELSIGDVLWRLAIAVAWSTLFLMAIGSIALAISSATEHPMLVVVSVLGGLIVCGVLMQIPALDWLQPYLLPTSVANLIDLVSDPVSYDGLAEGAFRAGCYLVIGLSLAYARIATRDG